MWCTLLSMFRTVCLQVHAKRNRLWVIEKRLKTLQTMANDYGLNEHGARNFNTSDAASIKRRMENLKKFHEYLNDTVSDDIDLTSKFIMDQIKKNPQYKEYIRNECREELVREHNTVVRQLRKDPDVQKKIAYTEVLRFFSQRDSLMYRKAV